MPVHQPFLGADIDLDEWVRHVVGVHFDPESGSPYWLQRANELGLRPEADLRTYADLQRLGDFDLNLLRTQAVTQFLPQSAARSPERLSIFETGGSTGSPARIAVRDFWAETIAWAYWYMQQISGFPGGENWLWVGPTGPHAVGVVVRSLANAFGGACFHVDMDPRFVKLLIARGDRATVALYMEHIKKQCFDILDTQEVGVLGTTPALLQALAPEIAERGLQFRGLIYGGTHLSPDLYHLLATQFFPEAVHVPVYGNTLMGFAPAQPYSPEHTDVAYTSFWPRSLVEVVDPADTTRVVDYGETGIVRITTLAEDLFLPNVLERDQAERCRSLPQLNWDGVANVRPRTTGAGAKAIEGVY